MTTLNAAPASGTRVSDLRAFLPLPGPQDAERYQAATFAEQRGLLADALAVATAPLPARLNIVSVLTSDLEGEVVELTAITPSGIHTRRARPVVAPAAGAVRVHGLDAAALEAESGIGRWFGRLPPLLATAPSVTWPGAFTQAAIDLSLTRAGLTPLDLGLLDLQELVQSVLRALDSGRYRPDLAWTGLPYGLEAPDRRSSLSTAKHVAELLRRMQARAICDDETFAALTTEHVRRVKGEGRAAAP